MTAIPFAGATIDRAAHRRTDEAWLAEARSAADARAVLVGRAGTSAGTVPLADHEPLAFLGVEEDGAPIWVAQAPEDAELKDLRFLAASLDGPTAGLSAYASALAHFQVSHAFCGRCGEPTQTLQGGHLRRCANEHEHYPRTDPVVIMLVTDGADRVIMGRQPSWPAHRYSALAGFVEQGESLDQAVAREVAEEAGVQVGTIRYIASQPWPFPCSLMLGFEAEYAAGDVHTADDELDDVRWFSREEVAEAARGDDMEFLTDQGEAQQRALILPPRLAIARHLVEHWLHRDRA